MSFLITLPSGAQIHAIKRSAESSIDLSLTPVLFIHGLLGSTNEYTPILPYFSDRTVILVDMPGHGSSPKASETSTIAAFAQDIDAALAHYAVAGKVDVVAHSGGCLVALQFAYDFPQKVGRLVLLGPPILPVLKEVIMANAEIVRASTTEQLVGWLGTGLGSKAKSDPEIQELLASELTKVDTDGAARTVEILGSFEAKPLDGANEVTVIQGTEDALSPQATCEKVIEVLGGGKLVSLVGLGHHFAAEDAKVTGEAVKDALSQ